MNQNIVLTNRGILPGDERRTAYKNVPKNDEIL